MIFNQNLPPPWMLRGVRESASSRDILLASDLQEKTTLALVCKTWNQVATDLLYRDVHLCSIGQLVAFSQTLHTPKQLGQLVRSLNLCCFVPRGYTDLFKSEIDKILPQCPKLMHLAYACTHAALPKLGHPGPNTLCMLPTSFHGSILTSIEFTPSINPALYLPALSQLSSNLRSLRLPFDISLGPDFSYPPLEFPAMEDLHILIHIPIYHTHALPMTLAPIWDWSMPGLKKLWVSFDGPSLVQQIWLLQSDPWVSYAPLFLQKYGRTILFLSLHVWSSTLHVTQFTIDTLCPRLIHLATTTVGQGPCHVITGGHPRVQKLDVWCSWNRTCDPPLLDAPELESIKTDFPALQSCRFLDATFVYFDHLPLDFSHGPEDNVNVEHQDSDDNDDVDFEGPQPALPAWLATIQSVVHPASMYAYSDLDNLDIHLEPEAAREPEEDSSLSDGDSDTTISDEDSSGVESEVDAEEALSIFAAVQAARFQRDHEEVDMDDESD
uniref:F-box domain-containing protein n=1 Tax=Mycena chlorophos TaxID=658473 RepID=A0ABQ0L1L8_MYCCL|nr:predicted protein [Mycena chlorophos]